MMFLQLCRTGAVGDNKIVIVELKMFIFYCLLQYSSIYMRVIIKQFQVILVKSFKSFKIFPFYFLEQISCFILYGLSSSNIHSFFLDILLDPHHLQEPVLVFTVSLHLGDDSVVDAAEEAMSTDWSPVHYGSACAHFIEKTFFSPTRLTLYSFLPPNAA